MPLFSSLREFIGLYIFEYECSTLFQEVRVAAEGLARLAAKALSREELTLAHTSLF